jgi:hypothetical protein
MNLQDIILELRRQLRIINEVITALESLERRRPPKRGRPPKYVNSSRLSNPLQRGEMLVCA